MTAQSVSALEILKRKYNWTNENSTAFNNPRLMAKSSEFCAPQLFLLLQDAESAQPETRNHIYSWLELDLGITEICGHGGSGKTQLCIGLCVSCVMQTYVVQYPDSLQHQPESQKENSRSLLAIKSTTLEKSFPQIGPCHKPHTLRNPYLAKTEKNSKLTDNSSTAPSSSSSSSSQPIISSRISLNPYSKIPYHQLSMPAQRSTFPLCAASTEQIPLPSYARTEPPIQIFYRAIYISMGEGVSEAQRAYRMNQIYESRRQTLATTEPMNTDSDAVLSRILSRCIYNEEEFHDWLFHQLPDMLSLHNNAHSNKRLPTHEGRIGIIVIDSMAGLFRISDEGQSSSWYVRRSGILFQAAAQLKKLSSQYHVPVVVVNQVSGSTTPALGLSWSHCINCRYFITRREEYVSTKDEKKQEGRTRFTRRIQLLLSSQWPVLLECSFIIDNAGCKLE